MQTNLVSLLQGSGTALRARFVLAAQLVLAHTTQAGSSSYADHSSTSDAMQLERVQAGSAMTIARSCLVSGSMELTALQDNGFGLVHLHHPLHDRLKHAPKLGVI